jgi:hypothetical protein
MPNTVINRVFDVIIWSCLCNWFAYVLISFYFGGTAFQGKADGGIYFFRNHGHYIQVSPGVYEYSKIHGHIAVAGLGIGIAALIARRVLRRFADEPRAA